MVYVSITGMRVHAPWQLPRFFWHAIPSLAQARQAPGNLSADAIRVDGVYHTLTIWIDRAAMLAYLTTGPHKRAMKAFPDIGTGYGFGFETDHPPRLDEVHHYGWRREEGVRHSPCPPLLKQLWRR